MKKNLIFIVLLSISLFFSCGDPNDIKIIGTWTCTECGENIGDYSIKFDASGDFVMADETIYYVGTWEALTDTHFKITFSNTDLGLLFYDIEELSDDELIVNDSHKTIEFKRVK